MVFPLCDGMLTFGFDNSCQIGFQESSSHQAETHQIKLHKKNYRITWCPKDRKCPSNSENTIIVLKFY
jgi:hypothetical protein